MANAEMYGARLDKTYVAKDRAPKSDRKRTRGIRQVSEKQAIRNAFLDGVKRGRIRALLETVGKAACESCGVSWVQEIAARRQLDLHHATKRTRGIGYRAGEPGVDDPRNLVLLCRKCHREAESNPEFLRSAS